MIIYILPTVSGVEQTDQHRAKGLKEKKRKIFSQLKLVACVRIHTLPSNLIVPSLRPPACPDPSVSRIILYLD